MCPPNLKCQTGAKGVELNSDLYYTSPLTPLRPAAAGQAGEILAGEGRKIERGPKAPSLNSLPLSNMLINGYLFHYV